MRTTFKGCTILFASALMLGACGGSSSAQDEARSGDLVVATEANQDSGQLGGQIGGNGASGTVDTGNGETGDAGNVIQQDSLESADQQTSGESVDVTTSGDQPEDDVPEQPESSGDDSANTSIDNDSGSQTVANTEVYPNSFCVEPGVTAVSYEDFQRTRSNTAQGVYVPFPASGFGWDGTKLCDLEGSRELDEIEVLVPFVRQRPDTDGVVAPGEWVKASNAGTYNYETRGNDIDNLLLAPVSRYQDGAGYSEWWAMHDGTNLYIRIKVSNDSITHVYSDSDDPWHDDSIELYIDGDNSKGDSYDGVNDFQVLLTADNNRLPIMPGDTPEGLRIFHRAGGAYSYNIEVTINLESAGIEIGRPFGFDVHINEDDNGDERDAKWGWFEKTGFDRSWHQPSAFGTLLLTDCENRDQCGSYQALSP